MKIKSITIRMVCPLCHKAHEVVCDPIGYSEWVGGALIQNVLPHNTPIEREQLISKLCPDCQKKIYGV